MKLLNKLRELRAEIHPDWMLADIDTHSNEIDERIGIGATSIEDIIRLNVITQNLNYFGLYSSDKNNANTD